MKDWRFLELLGADDIKRDLLDAIKWVCIALLLGLSVGFCLGWVGPSLPVAWVKVTNLVGMFLNATATWFALAHISETWGGDSVDEVWRPRVFKLLLLPGVVLQTIGAM